MHPQQDIYVCVKFLPLVDKCTQKTLLKSTKIGTLPQKDSPH
jgi:hypothetical protein